MNKVTLIGRLTKDVEMHYSSNSNNTAIARYTLAVDRQYKRDGEQEADFIRCITFGKTAEAAEKYLYKGARVAIDGRIQTGVFTNSRGQKVYTTDVVVERQEFLEKKSNNQPATDNQYNEDKFMDIPDDIDADLPFN